MFAWAGAAKAWQRPATAAAFAGLGLPAPGVLAVVVPAVELALAVALVAAPAAGAVAALVLLAFFTTLLVGVLRSGRQVGCGCFGRPAAGAVVRGGDVVRNGGLAALAAVALFARVPGGRASVAVGLGLAGVAAALAAARWAPR